MISNFELGKIHCTALVSPRAILGDNITVGPYTIIYDHVQVGSNSIIGPHCTLGEPTVSFYSNMKYQNEPLIIGQGALIRSGSILYSGSQIGDSLITGHGVTIREQVSIGDNLQLGTNSEIFNCCQIGDHVRINSKVYIGPNAKIGNFVWVFSYTMLTNDPHPPSENIIGVTIDDFAVISAHVVLMPGIKVAANSLIGAGSIVTRDVPEGAIMIGSPARKIMNIDELKDKGTGNSHYPWPEHFDRGMPWKGIGFKAWDDKRCKGDT